MGFLLVLLVCWSSLAFGSTHDVAHYLSRFVSVSEEIQAEKLKLSSARELKNEAVTKFFPSIELTASKTEQKVPSVLTGGFNVSPSEIYAAALEFEQPIFLGGRIWAGMKQRRAEYKKSIEDYKTAKNSALKFFLELLFAYERNRRLIVVLEEGKSSQDALVKTTRLRAKRGNARSYELAQVEAQALSYIPRIEALQAQLESQKQQIESLIGENFEPKGSFFLSAESMASLEKNIDIENHPQLKSSKEAVELALAAKRMELGEHYPSLVVTGAWGYRSISRDDIGEEQAKATSLTVGLSIPLFSGLSSVYVRRAAEARLSAAKKLKTLNRRVVDASIKANGEAFRRQKQQMASVASMVKKSQLALRQGLKNYRVGSIDNFQVTSLKQLRETSRSAEVDANYNLNISYLNWAVATATDVESLYARQVVRPVLSGESQ